VEPGFKSIPTYPKPSRPRRPDVSTDADEVSAVISRHPENIAAKIPSPCSKATPPSPPLMTRIESFTTLRGYGKISQMSVKTIFVGRRGTMTTRRILILLLLSVALSATAAACFADTPLPPPTKKTSTSDNGQYEAASETDSKPDESKSRVVNEDEYRTSDTGAWKAVEGYLGQSIGSLRFKDGFYVKIVLRFSGDYRGLRELSDDHWEVRGPDKSPIKTHFKGFVKSEGRDKVYQLGFATFEVPMEKAKELAVRLKGDSKWMPLSNITKWDSLEQGRQ